MKKQGRKTVWVNPDSHVLSFLPKTDKPQPKPRPRRDPEREADERTVKERQQALGSLDHEVEAAKRTCELARWNTKKRNAELGVLEDPETRSESTRTEQMEQVELRLRELEAIAKFGEETVTKARTKAVEIFGKLHMRKDEKRIRIRTVLDAYGVDERVLPPAILELLEEEEYAE